MTTIVSAFICNVNIRDDRTLHKYLELGSLLLKANIPKIIFIDTEIYHFFKYYENDNTKIISFNKYDIYLYKYFKTLKNTFSLNTNFPNKDTLEFIFTMCNKTEWIKHAIQLNLFNTQYFIWIDFGIRHVFNCNNDEFIKKIEDLSNRNIYNKLRIGTIWNLDIEHYLFGIDIYKDISWYFAGGVFGGNIEELLKFSNETKNMCIKIINEKQNLMWEVNIWYLIYKNNTNIQFSFYNCDHNDSIIDNY
jgi:hypothetical protein